MNLILLHIKLKICFMIFYFFKLIDVICDIYICKYVYIRMYPEIFLRNLIQIFYPGLMNKEMQTSKYVHSTTSQKYKNIYKKC